eukprot:TRINITY_DN8611_c0_g2_i2.p1 TRINITY_DN8611_c0_g2~~TRINITY_DN8611_c0_g2_i2.p1  ORF type:complete len:105 (-),score=13.19 TRINITY_DN8611_c0_g2_i2:3685-3999(-)
MGWAQRLGQDNWVRPIGRSTHGGPWAYPASISPLLGENSTLSFIEVLQDQISSLQILDMLLFLKPLGMTWRLESILFKFRHVFHRDVEWESIASEIGNLILSEI